MALAGVDGSASDWAQALSLFDQALDLPIDARAAWARSRPVSGAVSAALRRLVDERAAIETADFLGRGPVLAQGLPAGAPGEPANAGNPEPPGLSHIGPYRLIRALGQGGMSTVYLAERDDEQLRRQVALKIPHAGPGQEALAERLLRERDALVGLEHPHIARLYDVVLAPGGLPCLVLEYVEGQPIDVFCRAHSLTLTARVRLFGQVLRAVQFAHTRLVLHRDLKPSNILVDASGDVKLLDFGIAKMLDGSADLDSALTRQGGAPMTPDYAAPEQIAGQPLSTASDVYALGVVLYELLTVQRPYRLPRGTRGALEEAILATDPQRPSERWRGRAADEALAFQASPAALRRSLAGDLDLIVLQALRKRPTHRYLTVDALAQDLSHWLAREPVAARPDWWGYRLRRFVQRHALAVGAAALVSLSLVGGLGLALWQAHLARVEADRAQAIKGFLIGLFEASSLNQADPLRKSQQTVRELLEDSAGALQTGLAQQPALRSELQGLVGHLLSDLTLTDTALALRQQRVAQGAARGAPLAEQGEALRELAQTHEQRGEQAEQRATLMQAVALLQPAQSDAAQVQRWAAESSLGRLDLAAEQTEAARQHIEPAVAALQRLAPGTDLAAESLAALALLRSDQGRPDEASLLHQQAMDITARLYAGQPARLALARYRHAMALWRNASDLPRVEPILRAAWEGLRDTAGVDGVDTALVEQQLGLARLYRGDEAGALTALEHSRGILEQAAARIDPEQLLLARLYLAEAHLQAGRFDQAAPMLAAVRAEWTASPGQDSLEWRRYADLLQVSLWTHVGDEASALGLLAAWRQRLTPAAGDTLSPLLIDLTMREADVHQAAGRPAQGLAMLDDLERRVANPRLLAELPTRRCSMLLDLGRASEALPWAQAEFDRLQALPAAQRQLLENVAAHRRLARIWVALGQPQRALPLFDAALALYSHAGDDNTYLAALRAYHAQALAAAGQFTTARVELDRAKQALKRQPRLAVSWWRAVRVTERLLAESPSPRHLDDGHAALDRP